jgi:EmrB/QacA subfamily drug resistance transporter
MNYLKKWLAIIGMVMGPMVMGLSFSLINLNLDTIQEQLGGTLVQLQWIINTYGIFISSFLVTMGRLGDIFGRKKLYIVGLILLIIALVGSGCAKNLGTIIGFQVFYGLAGAILLPISQALLVEFYPDEQKSVAIGVWASAGAFTMAVGPLIGGILLDFFSWRSIFLVNIPFVLLGILLTLCCAKESKTQGTSTKIDWAGSALLITCIGTFIMATVQNHLWPISLILFLYGASVVSLVLLLWVEKKVEMPIILETLFKSRTFLLSSLGNFCMIAFFWAAIFLIPLYLQQVLQYTPLQAGVLMVGFALPFALLSPVAGRFYKSIGPKPLIFLGFIMLAASAILQLQFHEDVSPWMIGCATTLLGIGFGLIITPTTTGALAVISRNFAGIASGTFVTIQEIGGSLGLAVTVAVVHLGDTFQEGFHNGMWLMLGISIIGLISALLLPRKPKYKVPPEKVTERKGFFARKFFR